MTTYKTKIQYVSWNDRDLTSVKKAEIKKRCGKNQEGGSQCRLRR